MYDTRNGNRVAQGCLSYTNAEGASVEGVGRGVLAKKGEFWRILDATFAVILNGNWSG